jgi:hypothetical protein
MVCGTVSHAIDEDGPRPTIEPWRLKGFIADVLIDIAVGIGWRIGKHVLHIPISRLNPYGESLGSARNGFRFSEMSL